MCKGQFRVSTVRPKKKKKKKENAKKPRLVESKRNYTWLHFPRSYLTLPKTINAKSRDARGCLAQVQSRLMSQAPGNGSLITPDTFLSRIFETGRDQIFWTLRDVPGLKPHPHYFNVGCYLKTAISGISS